VQVAEHFELMLDLQSLSAELAPDRSVLQVIPQAASRIMPRSSRLNEQCSGLPKNFAIADRLRAFGADGRSMDVS
jgi:hypothetical protein